jgi:annexin A7/11
MAPVNVTADVQALYKAMKGFGTDEAKLNRVLAKATPDQVNAMREEYSKTYREDLIKRLQSETSGNYEDLLVAIARGPLLGDVWALKGAMKGMGTKEAVLNDVLVGRTNADINAIKTEYQKVHRTSLDADLKSDLSAATEKMFLMITAARRNENNVPTIPQQIEQDVTDLQKAFGNFVTKDPVLASQILTSRNDDQLRAIAYTYEQRFREPLSRAIQKSFTGHMEEALLLLLARAQNRALSDATQLEDSMAGIGTKDKLLIQRVVRAHWDPMHMQRVRTEYQNKYKTDLVRRIKGETSGHYEKLLVACVE